MDQCLGGGNNNTTNYNSNSYNTNTTNNYNNTNYYNSNANANANTSNNLKASVNSPFGVDCPYPGCITKHMEARFLPWHVDKVHGSATNHKFSCPVCQLMTGTSYSANDQTNLLIHIRTHHQDMIKPPDLLPNNSISLPNNSDYDFDFDFPDDNNVNNDPSSATSTNSHSSPTNSNSNSNSNSNQDNSNVGSRYVVQVLEEDMKEGECSICFEEFKKGESIARLECFCIFHQECVINWFKKSNNKCPLHKD